MKWCCPRSDRSRGYKKRQAAALKGVFENLAKARANSVSAEIKRKREEAAESLTNSLAAAARNALLAPHKLGSQPSKMSEVDRLREHISSCWSPPVGTTFFPVEAMVT